MEPTTLQTIKELIGSLGFPIVVTFYLLFCINKTMKELTEVIRDLKDAIYKSTFHPAP